VADHVTVVGHGVFFFDKARGLFRYQKKGAFEQNRFRLESR
jgi:hypothetical protein